MTIQHSERSRKLYMSLLDTVKKVVGDDDIIIVHPENVDLSYMEGYFPNCRIFDENAYIGTLSERLPILIYSYMFGQDSREKNTEFFKRIPEDNVELSKMIAESSKYHKLKYFIVDPLEVDPVDFGVEEHRIERYLQNEEVDRNINLSMFIINNQLPLAKDILSNMNHHIVDSRMGDDTMHLIKYANVFSMTAYSKKRQEQVEKFKTIYDELESTCPQLPSKFGYITASTNKGFEYSDYMDMISSSLTTFIIPSYDSQTISLQRIIESISRGCLPIFICPENLFDALEDNFPEFCDVCRTLRFDSEDEALQFTSNLQAVYAHGGFELLLKSDLIQYLQSETSVNDLLEQLKW